MSTAHPALQQFQSLLGADRARADAEIIARYTRNVEAQRRQVLGVLSPRSTEEVQALVRIANTLKTPLYTVSTGMNWGLGSRLPVQHGAFVVELGQMRRIIECDERRGILLLEAGVTQRDVYEYLESRKLPFFLNVTGSSAHSSVLGNTLDRGIAHHGSRVRDVAALEVVLGTGEVLRTGASIFPGSATQHLYPFGVGPDMSGLFFQSNLGIVTRAALKLRPKHGVGASLGMSLLPGASLVQLVDRLTELRHQRRLPDNLHVSNRNRRISVLAPLFARSSGLSAAEALAFTQQRISTEWGAYATVFGEPGLLEQDLEAVRHALRGLAEAHLTFEEDLLRVSAQGRGADADARQRQEAAWAEAVLEPFRHGLGVPSDVSLASLNFALDGRFTMDVDAGAAGTLFVLPLLPFDGRSTDAVHRCLKETFTQHGFEVYLTYNLVEEHCFEAVGNLLFERDNAQAGERAHACVRETYARLFSEGYPPYRAGIQTMEELVKMAPEHFAYTERLKSVFDPAGILSPGRYSLR